MGNVKYQANKINLDELSSLTIRFTGADIKNLVNFAGFNALKENREKIIHKDLLVALDRIMMGLSKRDVMTSYEEKLKTAYHEAGHTILSMLMNSPNKVHKVTILPRA